MSSRMVVFADAGPELGTGHVMRCLALARAWQAAGGDVTFATHCPVESLRGRIRRSGAELVSVPRRHREAADWDATLATVARDGGAGWIVLDGEHPAFPRGRDVRHSGRRLLVIDDTARPRQFRADVILNQNLGAEELEYRCDAETVLLAGSRYALVRPEIEACRAIVDRRGAERVAAVMRGLEGQLPEGAVRLRPIAPDDLLRLWRLANDPTVRRNSLSPDHIPLHEHTGWFARKLSDPASRIWVLDFCGLMLGAIRYDRRETDAAEISLLVAAAFRRTGQGSRLLHETLKRACRELRVARARAVVRQENAASARLFAKAGFTLVDSRIVRGQPCHVFQASV